jgi:hypothetical protein
MHVLPDRSPVHLSMREQQQERNERGVAGWQRLAGSSWRLTVGYTYPRQKATTYPPKTGVVTCVAGTLTRLFGWPLTHAARTLTGRPLSRSWHAAALRTVTPNQMASLRLAACSCRPRASQAAAVAVFSAAGPRTPAAAPKCTAAAAHTPCCSLSDALLQPIVRQHTHRASLGCFEPPHSPKQPACRSYVFYPAPFSDPAYTAP